jgi:nitroimidazol reductase NimA-like FMN-containing flavoprotein (pyridoxamine 5'-phosphate oxidase superfamily)
MTIDSPPPGLPAASAPPSARTRIRRIPDNARYDAATVHAIIDAALVCHVAFTDPAGVHCIPTACWRMGEHLYVHGSNGSRMLKVLQSEHGAAVTITHLDGLVLARSAFNHSMNYRSLVIYGHFEIVPEPGKSAALAAFLDHLLAGRQAEVRPGNAKELAATTVLRIGLDEAAAKVHAGPPEDDDEDMAWPVWAGVLPLQLSPQTPVRDAACSTAEPEYVRRWTERSFAPPEEPPAG